jgi:alpha-amylase
MENCRLCGLPDLDQDHEFVREFLLSWVKRIVDKYNFDGIRIDTLGHVQKEFWSEFGEASGVF